MSSFVYEVASAVMTALRRGDAAAAMSLLRWLLSPDDDMLLQGKEEGEEEEESTTLWALRRRRKQWMMNTNTTNMTNMTLEDVLLTPCGYDRIVPMEMAVHLAPAQLLDVMRHVSDKAFERIAVAQDVTRETFFPLCAAHQTAEVITTLMHRLTNPFVRLRVMIMANKQLETFPMLLVKHQPLSLCAQMLPHILEFNETLGIRNLARWSVLMLLVYKHPSISEELLASLTEEQFGLEVSDSIMTSPRSLSSILLTRSDDEAVMVMLSKLPAAKLLRLCIAPLGVHSMGDTIPEQDRWADADLQLLLQNARRSFETLRICLSFLFIHCQIFAFQINSPTSATMGAISKQLQTGLRSAINLLKERWYIENGSAFVMLGNWQSDLDAMWRTGYLGMSSSASPIRLKPVLRYSSEELQLAASWYLAYLQRRRQHLLLLSARPSSRTSLFAMEVAMLDRLLAPNPTTHLTMVTPPPRSSAHPHPPHRSLSPPFANANANSSASANSSKDERPAQVPESDSEWLVQSIEMLSVREQQQQQHTF